MIPGYFRDAELIKYTIVTSDFLDSAPSSSAFTCLIIAPIRYARWKIFLMVLLDKANISVRLLQTKWFRSSPIPDSCADSWFRYNMRLWLSICIYDFFKVSFNHILLQDFVIMDFNLYPWSIKLWVASCVW